MQEAVCFGTTKCKVGHKGTRSASVKPSQEKRAVLLQDLLFHSSDLAILHSRWNRSQVTQAHANSEAIAIPEFVLCDRQNAAGVCFWLRKPILCTKNCLVEGKLTEILFKIFLTDSEESILNRVFGQNNCQKIPLQRIAGHSSIHLAISHWISSQNSRRTPKSTPLWRGT